MKKFISWVSAIAVFVSIISCREAEELTTIPDEIQNQAISAKVKKDSVGITNNHPSNESNSLDGQESDPPPKNDEIKW